MKNWSDGSGYSTIELGDVHLAVHHPQGQDVRNPQSWSVTCKLSGVLVFNENTEILDIEDAKTYAANKVEGILKGALKDIWNIA